MTYHEQTRALKNLGLGEQEAQAYLALLKLGASQASAVAKEIGLRRTTIYPILQGLAEKGVVNVYFKNGKRNYAAQRPEWLARAFSRKLNLFETLIPTLPTQEKIKTEKLGIRYLEGKKEITAFYESLLDEYETKSKKDRWYRIISSMTWESIDPDFFLKFRYERSARGISTKLLLTADSRSGDPADPQLLRESRYLPEGYQFQDSLDIHDDKVLVLSHTNPVAIIIAIPEIVTAFKVIFDILWGLTPE
ncbi:MAG: helix-turn-helix domain-containing protein [Candidatus Paceibacterota bacterium]|jgi:sugar-specific transcriptional regulator TrmB